MDLIQIGKRIKQCRKRQHLTQECLAEKIEVSPHYIYEIERGIKTMSIFTLYNISTTLDVSTDYLLTGNIQNTSYDADKLVSLIEDIPPTQRDSLAEIISAILPYIK